MGEFDGIWNVERRRLKKTAQVTLEMSRGG
jgi:hypothetical protein